MIHLLLVRGSSGHAGLCFALPLVSVLIYAYQPLAHDATREFYRLPYYNAVGGTYTQGWGDLRFVLFGSVLFTVLRAVTMRYLLKPLARLGGVETKKIARFAEQGWLMIHHSSFWITGMYINYNSVYWMNLYELWTNFPTREMTGLMKSYYLLQLAFWLQQIFVLNFEKRRKDYLQMLTHHVITSVLLATSYTYYQTKVGNVILCLVDVVDALFAAAKLLKYLGFQTACDVAFGIFIVSWIAKRHVFYIMVCWSTYTHLTTVMPYGCYDSISGNLLPDSIRTPRNGGDRIFREILQSLRDPGGPICFNSSIRSVFLGLLGGLQLLMLVWLWMILKVAKMVFDGQGADDTRSDDEESASEELDGKDSCNIAQRSTVSGSLVFPSSNESIGTRSLHSEDSKRNAYETLHKRNILRQH
ncbi:TLC domain-containing protein [Bipolaris maydis]|uniref:TLC domain-containing protein n=1 Tax=Cochliobolus heterostrophus TaxID=5016 RepID=UPI0024DDEB5B|nr:TLC domain-containing protein [Bipolaris maydis]KAJ6267020.1 TLC domain-containing protein [Bipolaris maydis]KAJ6277638.1 TLC domain-containing protein [Bipolaris maydis]